MITEFFKFNNNNKDLVNRMLSNIDDVAIIDFRPYWNLVNGARDDRYVFDFEGNTYKFIYIVTGRESALMRSKTTFHLIKNKERIKNVSNRKLLKLYNKLGKHYKNVNKELDKYNL